MFGGEGADDLNDLWVYDCNSLSWTELKPKGNVPKARRFHSISLVDNRLYIFGGCWGKYNCLNDLHGLDLTSFIEGGKTDNLEWR